MRLVRRAALAATILLGAACAHYPVNPQLAKADPSYGYRFGTTNDPWREDENFIIVTMSGGGTRASALAYGVLLKLDSTKVRGGPLLDQIDVVSSVSGGSFTAAYYALHGRAGFPEFKSNFLEHDIQGDLFKAALNPVNWPKLLSRYYSRVDLAADLYDRQLFKDATYAQMPKSGRPFTILNATEMDLGAQFTFTQEQFDAICSDLSPVHVARAAAASSAFPGLLAPITLKSYPGQCGYEPGTWFRTGENDFLTNPRRYRFRGELESLMDPRRPYLHLMDGGIADNIGLRGPLHAIRSQDTLQMHDNRPVRGFSVQRLINLRKVKKVAVIIVNAKTENELKLDKSEATPNLINVISTAAGAPLSNYSFDTVELAREQLEEMADAATAARNAGLADFPDAKYYEIQVSFSALPKDQQQAYNDIGTNFSLSAKQVQMLIDVASQLLDASPKFQELVRDLQ
jgi:NTE family protein